MSSCSDRETVSGWGHSLQLAATFHPGRGCSGVRSLNESGSQFATRAPPARVWRVGDPDPERPEPGRGQLGCRSRGRPATRQPARCGSARARSNRALGGITPQSLSELTEAQTSMHGAVSGTERRPRPRRRSLARGVQRVSDRDPKGSHEGDNSVGAHADVGGPEALWRGGQEGFEVNGPRREACSEQA
jgi:hypothetical protein